MDDPAEPRVSEGMSETVLDVVNDSSGISRGQESVSPDDPPSYGAVLETAGSGGDEASESPPLNYDAVVVDSSTKTTKTLTVEAPPSYLHLFGKDEQGEDETDRGRQGRERGEDGVARLTSTKCCILFFFLGVPVGLPLTILMIILGSVYYGSCVVKEVSLYLIVGGLLLLLDIILHTILYSVQRMSDNQYLYNAIRRFDILTLFVVIWLIVGSIWIFKAKMSGQPCNDGVDYVTIISNMTQGDVGMGVSGDDDGGGMENGESAADCSNCPSGVYVFTLFLILIQYSVVLILGICCCCTITKRIGVRARRRRS